MILYLSDENNIVNQKSTHYEQSVDRVAMQTKSFSILHVNLSIIICLDFGSEGRTIAILFHPRMFPVTFIFFLTAILFARSLLCCILMFSRYKTKYYRFLDSIASQQTMRSFPMRVCCFADNTYGPQIYPIIRMRREKCLKVAISVKEIDRI